MVVKVAPFILFICLTSVLAGCSPEENSTTDDEGLFLYKGTILSDKQNVGAIIRGLQPQEKLESFSIYPEEEQVTVRYSQLPLQDEHTISITNASFLFNLIKDVEKILFRFDDRRYTIYKEDLQEWYNGDGYQNASDETDLYEIIQDNLTDHQKVEGFFGD
ncbi:hypothetical protein [Thalassobacillus hwangdonensis]|uniref:DUF4825 domain-containing protein n=1 Tax=Thalassobacillus hwangdonensis TaxID=546108 RepID=A0ABW3KZP1_9BACI